MIVLFFLTAAVSFAATVEPDNPNFQYSGRIDFVNPKAPVLFWPGSSIRATFQGAVLKIILSDEWGKSFYDVFIDEDYEHPLIIKCESGKKEYEGPAGLTDDIHTLLIFRRTEASTGPTIFYGLYLKSGAALLEPPAKPERRIEFYGNSITCGMGIEAADGDPDDNMAEENNFLTYAAITARNLNAEYSCISKSGIGIIISWFDLVMPDYYYRLNPDDPNSRWDFSLYRPDVVVVNLFQNDSWLIKNLDPIPDSTAIVAAYVDFINKIRTEYADAFIVCSLGSMDATKKGSPWPGYIEKAVAQMQSEGDAHLATYFFPFKNWYKHPRVRHHADMAEGLTQFVGVKMGWIAGDTTSVESKSEMLPPTKFQLEQNYPNPFNPKTAIEFTAPRSGKAEVMVFDTRGQTVFTKKIEVAAGGRYSSTVDLADAASGVYLYGVRMADNRAAFRKMTLLK